MATPGETTDGLMDEMDAMVMVGCRELVTMEKNQNEIR